MGFGAVEFDPDFWALGFNPARGNVATVRDLAEQFATASSYARDAHETIRAVNAASGVWTGKAADAFVEQLGDLPDHLDRAATSTASASRLLRTWADDLQAHQRRATELEVTARTAIEAAKRADEEAVAASTAARDAVAFATTNPPATPADEARLQATVDAAGKANADAVEAQRKVEEIRRQAEQLRHRWDDDCNRCANLLREYGELAPDEGLLEGIGEFASDSLGAVADIAGAVSTVAGVLAYVPVLNVVAAPVALASSGVAVAARATDMTINGKWDEPGACLNLAADAMGLIPGVGAVAKSSDDVAEVAAAGVRVARDGGEIATTGVRGAVNRVGAEMLDAGRAATWVSEHAGLTKHLDPDVAAKLLEGTVDVTLATPSAVGIFTEVPDGLQTSAGMGQVGVGVANGIESGAAVIRKLKGVR